MIRFRSLVRRLLEIILTFFLVSIFSFILMRVSPVDPATAYARRAMVNPSPEQIEELREELGFNKPLIAQYADWVWDALHLEFGKSLVTGMPALQELAQSVPLTMRVVLIAAVIEAIGAVFIGCLLYLLPGAAGAVPGFLTLAAISIPGFYIASVYLDLFATRFHWISVVGNSGAMKYFHPALCLSLAPLCFYARLIRNELRREEQEDYVFYERCRGLTETRILFHHMLPHGLIALIPSFLQNIGLTIAGAAIIERVFSLPGLGYLIIDSVLNRDTPMIHLEVLFLALMLVMTNIIADIAQDRLLKRNLTRKEEPV